MSRIQNVWLYDDRSNEIVVDLCALGLHFDSGRSLVYILDHGFFVDNCHRIEVEQYDGGEFGRTLGYMNSVFYWNGDGWESYLGNSGVLGIPDYLNKRKPYGGELSTGDDIIDLAGFDSKSKNDVFWILRTKLKNILEDLDPLNITRFPVMKNDMTTYAKESYDILSKIRGIEDESRIVDIIQQVFREEDEVEISDHDASLIKMRLLSHDNWHLCPVCKKHLFHNKSEKCKVCGWVYNERQENRDDEVSSDNPEDLKFRRIQFYLENNESTKAKATKISKKYKKVFEALLEVRKTIPKDKNNERTRWLETYYEGVLIDDGYDGDFTTLRRNTMKDYENLFKSYIADGVNDN